MNRPRRIRRTQTPGTSRSERGRKARVWWPWGRGVDRGVRYRVSGQNLKWNLPLSLSQHTHCSLISKLKICRKF